ncbi:hypothetical protein PFISCL1PPCAC_22484, partial [Pristionchus fissidentatus]
VLDGLVLSAVEGGGLYYLENITTSTLIEAANPTTSFVPEDVCPVANGPARIALERRIKLWKVKSSAKELVILKNDLGDIVGVSVDEDGSTTCGMRSCRVPGRSRLCEHVLALICNGRKDVEEFFRRKKRDLRRLLAPQCRGGQKPGVRPKAPRKWGTGGNVLGVRRRSYSVDATASFDVDSDLEDREIVKRKHLTKDMRDNLSQSSAIVDIRVDDEAEITKRRRCDGAEETVPRAEEVCVPEEGQDVFEDRNDSSLLLDPPAGDWRQQFKLSAEKFKRDLREKEEIELSKIRALVSPSHEPPSDGKDTPANDPTLDHSYGRGTKDEEFIFDLPSSLWRADVALKLQISNSTLFPQV